MMGVCTSSGHVSMSEEPTRKKTMASFRIYEDLWEKFGELAKRERLTATQALTEYIERCLGGNSIDGGVSTESLPVSTDKDGMQQSIDQLTTELTELRSGVSELTQLKAEVAEIKKLIADRPAPSPPTAAKEPSPPPDDVLTELVTSGLKATAIATKLTELGYTNSKGEPLTRENVNSRLKANSGLKAIYDTAKP
jgi:hypothetical protein